MEHIEARLAHWGAGLTLPRVRAHAVIVALATWFAFVVHFSVPALHPDPADRVAGDFYYFYTWASLASEGQGDALYNARAQTAACERVLAGVVAPCDMPPSVYGPQVALALSPLAAMPYRWALAAWLAGTTLIYGGSVFLIWQTLPALRQHGFTVVALAAGCPAFFYLIAFGQTSAPALACFTVAYLMLAGERRFGAGLALGTLAYKPTLGLAAAVVFLAVREWRVIAGAVAAGTMQVAAGWAWFGSRVMGAYLASVLGIGAKTAWFEPKPYHMHSLRAFFSMLLPWPGGAMALYVLTSVLLLVVAVRGWRRRGPLPIRFAMLLLVTVLIDPHLHAYDLVVLVPALLLVVDWAIARGDRRVAPVLFALVWASYLLPLVGPLSMLTHVQLSVVSFVLFMLTLKRILADTDQRDAGVSALRQSC